MRLWGSRMTEKYLSIQILGKDGIKLAAFKNKDKKNDKQPDYIGYGVAIWVNDMPDKNDDDL